MYDATKSLIKVENNLSEVFPCDMGARHGKKLLPVLFAMLINEFENNQSTQYNGVGYNQFFKTNIDLQLKLFTLLHVHDTIYLLM